MIESSSDPSHHAEVLYLLNGRTDRLSGKTCLRLLSDGGRFHLSGLLNVLSLDRKGQWTDEMLC